MATKIKRPLTYNPPTGEDRVYEKQYDVGYITAMVGRPDDNPYPTLDTAFSKVRDLKSYWWQAGYSDYEGA